MVWVIVKMKIYINLRALYQLSIKYQALLKDYFKIVWLRNIKEFLSIKVDSSYRNVLKKKNTKIYNILEYVKLDL